MHSSQLCPQKETECTVSAACKSFWGRTLSDLLWFICASYSASPIFPPLLLSWARHLSSEWGNSWRTLKGSSNQTIWFEWEAALLASKRNADQRVWEWGRADNLRSICSSISSLINYLKMYSSINNLPSFKPGWGKEMWLQIPASSSVCDLGQEI